MTQNRRFKRTAKFESAFAVSPELAATASQHDSVLERGLRAAAHLAQIFTLAVVAWGYYATVLPVFEKQKISEELSKLQLQKQNWDEQIDAYRSDLENLSVEKRKLEVGIDELESQRKSIVEEKAAAESLAEELRVEVKSARKTLFDAEEQFHRQIRSQLLGSTSLPISAIEFLQLPNVHFRPGKLNQLEQELAASIPKPQVAVERQIESLSGQIKEVKSSTERRALSRLLTEYQEGAVRFNSHLSCTEPSPEKWASAFAEAYPIPRPIVEECIAYHFDKQAEKESWTEKKIRKLKRKSFWKEQEDIYENACIFSLSYAAAKYFTKRWQLAVEPCRFRLLRMSDIVLNEFELSELDPFSDVSPPGEVELIEELREFVRRWDAPLDEN